MLILHKNQGVAKINDKFKMFPLQNNELDLDVFYKKSNIPKISLGDKVKVIIYLELPKEIEEGQKKEKERIQL